MTLFDMINHWPDQERQETMNLKDLQAEIEDISDGNVIMPTRDVAALLRLACAVQDELDAGVAMDRAEPGAWSRYDAAQKEKIAALAELEATL